jgi:hypothetical protein
MSAERVMAPLPTCEACWLKDHTQWEPESCDDDGNILMRLKGVDIPQKYNTQTVEVCSQCGKITISGIYELRDPEADSFTNQKISTMSRNTEAHFDLEESEEE